MPQTPYDISQLKKLEEIKVKELMKPLVEGLIDAKTPITNMIDLMTYTQKKRVFYVVEGNKIIGILDPYRILQYILLKTGRTTTLKEEPVGLRFLLGTTAKDYIGPLITLKPEDTAIEAAKKMVENRREELPIISEEGKLMGEISFIDILNQAITLIQRPNR